MAKLVSSGKLLNIEVGDRIIKVCLSARHGKSFQILDSFMFQTPDGTVSDGQIVHPEEVAQRLTQELETHGAKEAKNVVFTLSSGKVATREVMLPPVKDNRIKTVVETNAADYFPVDMSNYRVSSKLLERIEGGENPGCRVLVSAAPLMLIDSYARLAEAAGLQIEAIDYCGNSQYQVLRGIKTEDAVMYVDVNVMSTLVTFMANGVLLLQRNFPAGGDELITTAMRASGRSDSEYLQTMQDAGSKEFLDGILDAEQQADCLSRLVSGVVRSADFFKSDHTDTVISQVVLIGTCSHLAGLREELNKEIDIDTVLLTEVGGVQFVANSAEGVSSYISCIGSMVAPLELLPEEYKVQSKKKKFQDRTNRDPIRTGVIVAAGCVILGILLSAVGVTRYIVDLNRQKRMQARIDELSYVQDVYNTYVSYESTDKSLDVAGTYAQDQNSKLTAFLSELEMKMPSSILVLSATCDEEGVTMNITVPSFSEAAVVLSQLRTFDSIAVIRISGVTEAKDDSGATTASFSVACGYPVPATQTDVSAAPATATDTAPAANAG
jgi:type IV pilus assembly protein PilN